MAEPEAPRRRKPTRPLRIVAVVTPTVAYGAMLLWWVITEPKIERRVDRMTDTIERSSERAAIALEKIVVQSEHTKTACERTEKKLDALAAEVAKMSAQATRR